MTDPHNPLALAARGGALANSTSSGAPLDIEAYCDWANQQWVSRKKGWNWVVRNRPMADGRSVKYLDRVDGDAGL